MRPLRAPALICVLFLLLVAAAACGGDDDGSDGDEAAGGDPDAFCERLEELDDADELDLDETEAFEAFDELVDLAPEDLAEDLSRIQEAFEELSDLDEDDPDSFGAAFEIILDPRVASALEGFAEYAEDECGVEVEGANVDDDFTDDLSADFSTDLSTDFGTGDDEPSNTDLLRAFFEENYADEPWLDAIGSRGIGSVTGQSTNVTLGMNEVISPQDAVEACEAALAWADDAGFAEGEAEIQGPDQETLASGDSEEGCEAA
jgi:hypothetical protein